MGVKRVCVYCGSSPGTRRGYAAAAAEFGASLARREIGLVYGGGKVGLMGIVADAVLSAGGNVIGVIPEQMVARELAHQGVTKLEVTDTMSERKIRMGELSDGFVALPGGFGTLEEFSEVLSWAQIGLHRKPIGFLNVDGFYEPLLRYFDHMVTEGFVRPESRSLVLCRDSSDGLLEAMEASAASDP